MDTNQDTVSPKKIEGVTGSMSMIELSALINRYVADIEKVKDSLKLQSSMYKDAFENDSEFHEKSEKVKETTRERNAVKQRIVKQPAVEALTAKINELKSEVKDLQESLSGYLEEYQRVSGTNIIEGEDGEIREIVPVYRLVKRKA